MNSAGIEFEVEPYKDDPEIEIVIEPLDDEEDADGGEILNPYTGELEKKSNYPDVEYLDLEKVVETEEPQNDTGPNSKKVLSRKHQRQQWRETNKQEWLNIYQQFMQQRAQLKKTRGGTLAVPEQWSKKALKRKPPEVVFEKTGKDENYRNPNWNSKQNKKTVKRSKGKSQKRAKEIMESEEEFYDLDSMDTQDTNQEESLETAESIVTQETITETDFEDGNEINIKEYKKRLLKEEAIEDEAAEENSKLGLEQSEMDTESDATTEVLKKRMFKEFTLDDGSSSVTIKIEHDADITEEDSADKDTVENSGEAESQEENITPIEDIVKKSKRQRLTRRKVKPVWKIKRSVLSSKRATPGRSTSVPRQRVRRLSLEPSVELEQKHRIMQRNTLEALRSNAVKLARHSNICLFKWGKDVLACFYCQQRFKHMSMLRAHTKSDHNFKDIQWKLTPQFYKADITDLECNKCHTELDNLKDLQAHLVTHGIKFTTLGSSLVPYKLCTDTFTCQLCGKATPSLVLLRKHMKRHVLKYTCEFCKKVFLDDKSLKQHECPCFEKKECRVCGEIFSNNGERRRHEVKIHDFHSEITMKFKCSYCSQMFRYNYKRVKHMVEVHNAETELYQCGYCPKVFITVHWCSKHMNREHRDKILGLKKK